MTTDDADPHAEAAEILEARLEDRRLHPLVRGARVVVSFVIGIVSGGAGDDALPGLDLVVTRQDTGAEVLRVSAGRPQEADLLLQRTRRDLETMTVEQFVRSWRVVED